MLTNRYQFIEKLQDFIESPTETEYLNIKNYLKGKISPFDFESWLGKIKAADIFFQQLPQEINKSHIGLLLLLSIGKDLGIGIEQNIPHSAKIIQMVIRIIKSKKTENEVKASHGQKEKNDPISLLGFCYYLLGYRLIDTIDLRQKIQLFEKAYTYGYKLASFPLGILHYNLEELDKALQYFQLALQEANCSKALLKMGHIYIKYGKHVTGLKNLNENERIKKGMHLFRIAHKKGINIEKEILALFELYPQSNELLYHAAIIAKDKKAAQKLKLYIQQNRLNLTEIFAMIQNNNDDVDEVNKALANGHVENLFLTCIPKKIKEFKSPITDIKSVSSETILTEFQQHFEHRKLKAIEELRAREGETAESFILFLEDFKSGDPRKLFKSKIILLEFKKGDFTTLVKTKKLNSRYFFADCIKRDMLTKIAVHEIKENILKSHKQEFIKQQLSSPKDSDSFSIDPKKAGILLQEQSVIEKEGEFIQNEIQTLQIKYLDSYAKASAEINKCEQTLQALEQEKKAFIEQELASCPKPITGDHKKEIAETADLKYAGRITGFKNKINSYKTIIREVQLNHLLLYVDNYTKAGLDIALDQNIPAIFIEKIEELSSLFHCYREKYLTARKIEYYDCMEKSDAQTLLKAMDELHEKTQQPDQKETGKADAEKPKNITI